MAEINSIPDIYLVENELDIISTSQYYLKRTLTEMAGRELSRRELDNIHFRSNYADLSNWLKGEGSENLLDNIIEKANNGTRQYVFLDMSILSDSDVEGEKLYERFSDEIAKGRLYDTASVVLIPFSDSWYIKSGGSLSVNPAMRNDPRLTQEFDERRPTFIYPPHKYISRGAKSSDVFRMVKDMEGWFAQSRATS
jgi:hypothetical protein